MVEAAKTFVERVDDEAAARRRKMDEVNGDLSAVRRALDDRIDVLRGPDPAPAPPDWVRAKATVAITDPVFQVYGDVGVVTDPAYYGVTACLVTCYGHEVAVPWAALAPLTSG